MLGEGHEREAASCTGPTSVGDRHVTDVAISLCTATHEERVARDECVAAVHVAKTVS